MKIDIYGILFSALFLSTLTVFFGMFLGNLKCLGRMRFGVGGPLFVGVFVGWIVNKIAFWIANGDYLNSNGFFASLVSESSIKSATSILSGKVVQPDLYNFMLILFVTAVGLLASKDLKVVLKKYGTKFIIFGFIVTFIGAAASYATIYVFDDTNIDEASGVFTGALTSSPGLASAIEKATVFAEERSIASGGNAVEQNEAIHEAIKDVNIGHAVAYPFGMIAVILAMSILPKLFRINVKAELEKYHAEVAEMQRNSAVKVIEPVKFDLKAFTFVCLVGYLIGKIEIFLGSLGYFSLGFTGGTLIAAIICGYFGKIGPLTFRMDDKVLGSIRDLTLSFYVGMMGINYGDEVVKALVGSGVYFAVASIVIAVICILIGFFIGRYIFKINYIMLSGAICGGMTSTPGLGMAIDALGSDEPAAGYAAAYPAALIGMVLFIVIMYHLPVPGIA